MQRVEATQVKESAVVDEFHFGGQFHTSSIEDSGLQIQLKAIRLKAGGIHHEVLI